MFRKIYLFFGPPGSGKGTQSDMLGQKLKLPVISAGELLRYARNHDKKRGPALAKIIDQGKLVPDDLIFNLISRRASRPDAKTGFILDGYPRHRQQLKDLLKLLKPQDRAYALEIRVGRSEVYSRIGGRRVCDCGAAYHLKFNPPKKKGICDLCGHKIYQRQDDVPRVIKKRFKDYEKWIKPIFAYFRKQQKLIIINGQQSIAQVQRELLRKIKL